MKCTAWGIPNPPLHAFLTDGKRILDERDMGWEEYVDACRACFPSQIWLYAPYFALFYPDLARLKP